VAQAVLVAAGRPCPGCLVRLGTVLDEMKRVLRPDGRMLLIDFEVGPVRPLRGWITKTIIAISELAARRRHHRNSRNFMVSGPFPLSLLTAVFRWINAES
jgi:SAM-dependent methyltransferase